MLFSKTTSSPLVGRLVAGLVIGCLCAAAWAATTPPIVEAAESAEGEQAGSGVAAALLQAIEPAALREVAAEALARSPAIAQARQRAAAAYARAPQVRALPDPVAALTYFVLPPETRVGPQRFSASIQQQLPWLGKLALAERAALFTAAAAEAEVERARLDVLTEVRRLAYELAFHGAHGPIVEAERGALVRYEKAAQARYGAGTGLQQAIVRIQAQITRSDIRLLEIAEHHGALLAALNALRDRPADTPVGALILPPPEEPRFDRTMLRQAARQRRPELAAADAEIAAHDAQVALAEKRFRPDLTLGLSYTEVGRRDDDLGRANPPQDNGDDILALTGSIALPLRRRKLEAGVVEAQAARRVAEEGKRRLQTEIERAIGDLTARLPLLYEHWVLLETVLLTQAREALRSAETAYSTGRLQAVELLDAEVVLYEVQIAAARTRADFAVARAELERAVAHPLNAEEGTPMGEGEDHGR